MNFKDGLAAREDGRVARSYPLVPGHRPRRDGGRLRRPRGPASGRAVLANGYDIGTARHGGFGELRADPGRLGRADARRPDRARRDGDRHGRVHGGDERRGARGARACAPGDGPVLVTGASGGVGSTAVAILAQRGHEVWAATGKPDEHDRLARPRRGGVPDPRRGHRARAGRSTRRAGRGRWTRSARRRCRTCCGRSASAPRSRRRGTRAARTSRRRCSRSSCAASRCSGWTRANMPIEPRRALWGAPRDGPAAARHRRRRSRRSTSTTLEPALDAIVDGEARGRWVVRVAG